MARKQLVLVVVLSALVERGLSVSCVKCPPFCDFPPPGHPGCQYGLVDDVCGCCQVCGKGQNETCGYILNFDDCGLGLKCEYHLDVNGHVNGPGKCIPSITLIHDWTTETNSCIKGHNIIELKGITSLDHCKAKCEEPTRNCRSVEYDPRYKRCMLNDADSSSFDYKSTCHISGWIFTEMIESAPPSPRNDFTIGHQTFVVLESQKGVTWDQAKNACLNLLGYELAQPNNLRSLATYLKDNYGLTYYWLAGHGTGNNVQWLSGQVIDFNSLWRTDYKTSREYCVYLRDGSFSNPLGSYNCSDTKYLYPLCELKAPPPAALVHLPAPIYVPAASDVFGASAPADEL